MSDDGEGDGYGGAEPASGADRPEGWKRTAEDREGGDGSAEDRTVDGDDNIDRPLGDLAEAVDGRRDGTEWPGGELENDPDGAEINERRGPMGEVATAVEERRTSSSTVDEGLFAEEEIPEVDAEVVWQQLEEGGPIGPPSGEARASRVVEKEQYCERCDYLSDPPEMACTYEGTEIQELVDVDHVRVVDCPVVRENEELEDL